ncbi:MAG: Hsp20/alpha crystallin family protein [Myxococcota bacterium]
MNTLDKTPETQNSAPARTEPVRPRIPEVDVYQNAQEFLLLADMPGVTEENLEIRYERGRIDVLGKREGNAPYHRSFAVPGTIATDRISAEIRLGVLHLHLPKSEAAKPRQIRVTAS